MLEIKHLSLSVDDTKILDDINLTAKPGQLIVISGKSGSGKSTIIKALNGIFPFHQPAQISGDIALNGESILDNDIQARSAYLTTVFQNPNNQFYCINSTDEMAFPLENRNIERQTILATIDEHTKLLNTEHLKDKSLMALSGGQKQLVAITSVSVMNEQIYLLDEPSASLDQQSIEQLAHAISTWKARGKIVIVAEHRLYYLADIMDDLVVIEDGKIVEQASCQLRSLKRTTLPMLCDKNDYKRLNVLEKQSASGNMLLQNYRYSYQKEPVLDFDFAFDDSKITFIVGNNGIGKSTFIHCLCGLNKGFKGSTKLNDLAFRKKGYRHCALVMQDVNHQLFTESVYQEIKMACDDDAKIDEILALLDLLAKKEAHPMSLSGGQKQRVAIGNAWASDKRIIVFDEPTSGLCYASMMAIKSIIETLKAAGKKVIVVTHDYEFINCFENEEIVEFCK